MELDIKLFIEFIDNLKDGEKLLYRSGVLMTEGCEGDFGCCSKSNDVIGLVDELKKLVE
jgi:hypothetical protein